MKSILCLAEKEDNIHVPCIRRPHFLKYKSNRVRKRRRMSTAQNNNHKFTRLYDSLGHQDLCLEHCTELRKFLVLYTVGFIVSNIINYN